MATSVQISPRNKATVKSLPGERMQVSIAEGKWRRVFSGTREGMVSLALIILTEGGWVGIASNRPREVKTDGDD